MARRNTGKTAAQHGIVERPADGPPGVEYLPDFCNARAQALVVLSAELLAMGMAFMRAPYHPNPWEDLAWLSLFVQTILISWAFLVCNLRRLLGGWKIGRVFGVAYVLLLIVAFFVAEALYWGHKLVLQALPDQQLNHASLLAQCMGMTAMGGAVALRYFYVHFEWKRNVDREMVARTQALQARIRPHFLFNTLNTIAQLARTNADAAEIAVENLADLYRASLAGLDHNVSLEEEIEVCKRYIAIEQYRLGQRLIVEWDVDRLPLEALLPCLSLQPLVENAVYHGIEPAPNGGTIKISGDFDGRYITLYVSNPVTQSQSKVSQRKGNHIAQDNTRLRFSLAFAGEAELLVEPQDGEYRTTLHFPYREVL